MSETADDSLRKASINLSRNLPVALVVGAASFLGSHLTDKLLEKGIQVVGIDDLKNGDKKNLDQATENRNFHLVIESPDHLDLDLPRLDYIFIVSVGSWGLEKILENFKKFHSRCLLVSSIDLYEKGKNDDSLKQLRSAEGKIAKFASEFKLNARVLRLGATYGPRMDFAGGDPIVKLIQQALTGNLQKDVTLEFSSRALYAGDAVDLIIRTIFAGSTSQKIFDGVSITPVKVSEIKQVLLDPVWYESRDFVFSDLPPWPTPNLSKTVKFLNWQPTVSLIGSLRETLAYFKDNEIKVPEIEKNAGSGEKQESWREDNKESLEQLKEKKDQPEAAKLKKGMALPKLSIPFSRIYLFIIAALISYALIWPMLVLGWGIVTFRSNLDAGLKNLAAGEFDKSLTYIKEAQVGIAAVQSIWVGLEPIQRTGLFRGEFETGDRLINAVVLVTTSIEETAVGVQDLLQSIKMVTGEQTEAPDNYFASAKMQLSSAQTDLSKTYAILQDETFKKNLPRRWRGLPAPLAADITGAVEKLVNFGSLVNRAEALSVLLPKLTAVKGPGKNYLILLQNNMELRPGGGFIGSFAKVSFAGGKLKNLEVNDVYNIDGNLKLHVEPPKEIKEDLGQKDWFLRDANWEPDFPTSARQAEWFYTKETGERVDGTIALDVSAMQELLSVIGPLNLPDYNETISADNLFEKAVSHAESNFFPGSQAKKSFLTALSSGLFNKIFFLPQNNWPATVASLGRSLDQKHISLYLDDPKLFSYALSQNFAHILPREQNSRNLDFLSLVEANLGANKANYYLDRNYKLETVISKDGEVKHRLRISYTNRSPSDVFPAGSYKNRMRVYLPFGSKLTRVLWGEGEIGKDVTSFIDYGRSGYSMLLTLAPKEQKVLVLDYSPPLKLEFKDGKGSYRLDIIKQAGTLKDPFVWTMSYPINFKATSDQVKTKSDLVKTVSPQEQTVSTDLSVDRSFEVEFRK